MKLLMITWTDIFEGFGNFCLWVFRGMKMLGHGPNVLIWILIIGGIFYWTFRLTKYRKSAQRNGTLE